MLFITAELSGALAVVKYSLCIVYIYIQMGHVTSKERPWQWCIG